MWKNENLDLGNLKEGEPVLVNFEYITDGRFISASSSCGCSVPNWDNEKKVLEVTFTPGAVPKHLEEQGFYETEKEITVVMIEDLLQKNYPLKIQAKIHK